MVEELGGRGNVGVTVYDRFKIGDCHVWADIDGNKILTSDDTLRCCYRYGDMPTSTRQLLASEYDVQRTFCYRLLRLWRTCVVAHDKAVG